MHFAAQRGSIPIIKYLAENGGSLEIMDASGSTPWAVAKRRNEPSILETFQKLYTSKGLPLN